MASLLFLPFFVDCLVNARVVTHIPSFGPPPTVHHSGFIEVDESSGTNLFYYLVESQYDPDSDPLIWWMNGGPGASSLIGLLSENGPLLLNEAQRLVYNPFSWNRRANVVYVEFGPGVGYSFCANSSRSDSAVDCPQYLSDCSPCAASDTSVTQQSVTFIEKFLTSEFPSLAGRPLYLTGESYAGVYVPALVSALLTRIPDTSIVNIHGIWVTDACTDNWAQSGWLDMSPGFCFQAGLITRDVHDALTDPMLGCFSGITPNGDKVRRVEIPMCRRAWRLYDLATAGMGGFSQPRKVPGLPLYLDPLNAYGAAGEVDVASYLSRLDVRRALNAELSPNKVVHLELGNNGYSNYVMEHQACRNLPGIIGPSMLDVYRNIFGAKSKRSAAATNLRAVIISSGEDDPVVAMAGTELAVKALGFPEVNGGSRRPWFYNASGLPFGTLSELPAQWGQNLHARGLGTQVGGFVTDYATGISELSLMFVSVRNSGHMVSAYAPEKAFHMLDRVLLRPGLLSPLLPVDWIDMGDEAFYGWHRSTGGAFSRWAREAMAQESQTIGQLQEREASSSFSVTSNAPVLHFIALVALASLVCVCAVPVACRLWHPSNVKAYNARLLQDS